MLPSNYRFRVIFFHILNVVENQMTTLVLYITLYPTKQLSLIEVCNVSCINFGIEFQTDPRLFMSLQIDRPYFAIEYVQNHNLFWTDHLDGNRC